MYYPDDKMRGFSVAVMDEVIGEKTFIVKERYVTYVLVVLDQFTA